MIAASGRWANQASVTLDLAAAADQQPRVTAVRGREAMSELFAYAVEISADDLCLSADELLGTVATLRIRAGDALSERCVNGIVRRVERGRHGVDRDRATITLVPGHWLLTRRHQSRVFVEERQADMTVPGVIARVLADAGFAGDTYRFVLREQHEPRQMIIQYRESDFDFISRLMEDDGLFYFFEQAVDGHCLVISDDPSALPVCSNEYVYREPSGLPVDEESVYEVSDRREIQAGAVALDDFNFRLPAKDLSARRAGNAFSGLEYSDYPGKYQSSQAGERYARIRLEEQDCARESLSLHSNIRSLAAGWRFNLAAHPVGELNREYLATAVELEIREPQADEQEARPASDGALVCVGITALPAAVHFRPPRKTARPSIPGIQTAIVVGPQPEEIHTDVYGRVKVQFHWDRTGGYDDASSAWLRVSQAWAGGGYGAFFLPRVGQEVIVEFEEGDPDRPLVTGRVHNNDQMPPYKLPDHKTRSTIKSATSRGAAGSNELRFEDRQGAEQLLLHAAKDLHVRAQNDLVQTVARQRHAVTCDDDFELIRKSQHREVRLDLCEKVGGTKSLTVAGDVGVQVDGNRGERVGGNYTVQAGQNVVIEASQGLTLKAGGNFIKIDATGITILGTMVKINSGGAADIAVPVTPKLPEAPAEADTVDPGRNVRYSPAGQDANAQSLPEDRAGDEENQAARPASWIEIELVDEIGQPVANERYELTLPDGSTRRGSLGADGLARVSVPDPGLCRISFPNLDAAAWSRASDFQADSAAAVGGNAASDATSQDEAELAAEESATGAGHAGAGFDDAGDLAVAEAEEARTDVPAGPDGDPEEIADAVQWESAAAEDADAGSEGGALGEEEEAGGA